MAHRIQIARAWCDEHLAQCYFSHDGAIKKHLGDKDNIFPNSDEDFIKEKSRLNTLGYTVSHPNGIWTFTRYKSQPLALPLDWQMASEERESVDVYQDW